MGSSPSWSNCFSLLAAQAWARSHISLAGHVILPLELASWCFPLSREQSPFSDPLLSKKGRARTELQIQWEPARAKDQHQCAPGASRRADSQHKAPAPWSSELLEGSAAAGMGLLAAAGSTRRLAGQHVHSVVGGRVLKQFVQS